MVLVSSKICDTEHSNNATWDKYVWWIASTWMIFFHISVTCKELLYHSRWNKQQAPWVGTLVSRPEVSLWKNSNWGPWIAFPRPMKSLYFLEWLLQKLEWLCELTLGKPEAYKWMSNHVQHVLSLLSKNFSGSVIKISWLADWKYRED